MQVSCESSASIFRQSIGYLTWYEWYSNYKKQGAGPEQKQESEECLYQIMPNHGSKTPPSYLQGEI